MFYRMKQCVDKLPEDRLYFNSSCYAHYLTLNHLGPRYSMGIGFAEGK